MKTFNMKNKNKISISERKAAFVELIDFCVFANKDDYMEVTKWTNGQGYDIDINGKKHISMTIGEFDALKTIIKKL